MLCLLEAFDMECGCIEALLILRLLAQKSPLAVVALGASINFDG